ncbi:MAG: hypothetical protein AAB407_01410 [Patescibacteria group bacterium]
MKEVSDVKKLPYWREEYLYILKNLLLGQQAAKKAVSNAYYLLPPNFDYATTYVWLGRIAKQLDFTFNGKFHRDIYEKYNPANFKELQEYIEKNPEAGSVKFFKNILEDRFTIIDFADRVLTRHFERIFEFIEFETALDKKTEKKIEKYLNGYIKLFMEDKLKSETKNYVLYKEMKKSMLSGLLDLYKKYGDDFIIDKGKIMDFHFNNEYQFIHTVLALEYEGFIKLDYFWVVDSDKNPNSLSSKDLKNAKANITIKETFLSEAEKNDYSSLVSKLFLPKQEIIPQLKFDPIKSLLFVGSVKVMLRNHSNQYELLKIAFKNPDDAFREWFYSEIAEEYEPNQEPNEKRFENAAYQLNSKIIRETGLRDVMEVKKRSVIFNQKYKGKT